MNRSNKTLRNKEKTLLTVLRSLLRFMKWTLGKAGGLCKTMSWAQKLYNPNKLQSRWIRRVVNQHLSGLTRSGEERGPTQTTVVRLHIRNRVNYPRPGGSQMLSQLPTIKGRLFRDPFHFPSILMFRTTKVIDRCRYVQISCWPIGKCQMSKDSQGSWMRASHRTH